MISIKKWKKLANTDLLFPDNGDFLSDYIYLNYQREQFLKCTGFKISIPYIKRFFYIEYKKDTKSIILPARKLKMGEVEILCDITNPLCCSSGYELCDEKFFDAMCEIVSYLKKKFSGVQINHAFADIDDCMKSKIEIDKTYNIKCVAINISGGYEEWKKSLSKNSKQNQRTAYNRVIKDGRTLEFSHCNKPINNKQLYKHLFLHRYRNIERRNGKIVKIVIPLVAIAALIDLSDPWSKCICNMDGSYTAECYIDGRLASCLTGIIYKRRFIISYLSYNTTFRRYDPGRILINESIKYLCDHNLADKFDLYKGTEEYKYYNGGEEYNMYSFIL